MDEFLTEEQEAERARQWLRQNGAFLAAGVVLGLALLFGWQRWESYELEQSSEAAVVWEQLNRAIEGDRFNEASETLALLESDYGATPYADQARLAMARMHMERNAADEALEVLRTVARSSDDPGLRRLAELRIAQILIYLEQYDDALVALGTEDATGFAAQFHELRGDVFFGKGQIEDARDEYAAALDADTAGVIDRAYVQMKLDDVASAVAALPATADPLADAAADADTAAAGATKQD